MTALTLNPTINNITGLDFSPQAISVSQIDESVKALEQAESLENKFLLLKKDVGDELFDQLSYEQKTFIVNVSNTINLGDSVNIDVIYNSIERLEYE